ncbi:ABC transporter ATP-binding protein [Ancylobacter sp. WKF20]|uniref:ABC transporter ATP-binding protein n=1 Tax=Ancylobacter sp. WKF20 TaxID=3039801 RepID=UPI0024345CF7|nr:ABC transporter ATP-binding protein [Ancylobacter sp. WKF20]WGD29722.1 ABC transporter ATP-binding protein [Ancylobacter sp. WKF20]
MTDTPPIVAFDKVSKTYDEKSWIVDNLSLDIRAGEFLTLLGPSGSGKTTTLMMLAGFETPDHGRILMDGRDIVPLAPHKRDMGVVFQSYALFPHMSVDENIEFPLVARGVAAGERRRRVAEALDLVQLGALGGRRPGQLSGGQQQRIALARALVYRPRLVLMDEPLGALDKALRLHMQTEIKQLHQQLGLTFVYVTHDQDEALTMSDRIAIFHQGKIAQLGGPEELYNRPRDVFVAGFLGQTNLLTGRYDGVDDQCSVIRLADGTALRAQRPEEGAFTLGQTVNAAIRPERIRLAPAGAAGPAADGAVLAGPVTSCVFHGDHLTLHVDILGRDVVAKINPGETGALPVPGEIVRLLLPSRVTLALA